MRRVATATLLLGSEVAALVLVVRLGSVAGFAVDWSDPARWLTSATPEEALAAVLRLVALAALAWLLVATGLCVAASGRPGGRTAVVARAVTTRRGLRLVERALAVSLVTGTTLGATVPLGAGEPPPPLEVEIDVRSGRADPVPRPVPEPAALPQPAPTPDEPPAAPAEHVVEPGECLWSIAAARLARTTARTPGSIADAEIAAYWVEVMAANQGRLTSGDPNLIYPGEVVLLPE